MRDPLFAARMAYCGPRGIPLSRFLAWPPGDQEAALAWQAHENRRCGGCGTHPDEWNPKRGGDRNAYHAEDYQCPGCVAVQRHNEQPRLQDPKLRGMHVRLAPGIPGDCVRCNPRLS